MIRNNKGEFAQSKAKDTVVVLFTAFIMLGIAYYAHNVQAQDYDTRNGESTIKEIINPKHIVDPNYALSGIRFYTEELYWNYPIECIEGFANLDPINSRFEILDL